MRNELLHIKETAVRFLLITIYFVSTASFCDGTVDTRPSIEEKYPEKWDMPIYPPQLRYDLTACNFDSYGFDQDRRILTDYHGLCFDIPFSINNLGMLLLNSDEKYSAEVSFIFSCPDCRGDFVKKYNRYDESLKSNVKCLVDIK